MARGGPGRRPAGARRRLLRRDRRAADGAAGARAGVPVLCVGNFTLGGAGKTPTAMWLAKMLQEAGERPFCLSRGYGGSLAGPKLRGRPYRQRRASRRRGAAAGARGADDRRARPRGGRARARKRPAPASSSWTTACRMLRSPRISRIAVVDGRRGIGNGCVFPAGPLRAPLAAQLARTDALLVIGDGDGARAIAAAGLAGVSWPAASPMPRPSPRSKRARCWPFAGIGDPDKFFATAAEAGIAVAAAPGLSRSSPLQRRRGRRADHAAPSTTGLRCSPPKRIARA